MAITNSRQTSAGSPASRPLSWKPSDLSDDQPRRVLCDLHKISSSLNILDQRLETQQVAFIKDFESRIRRVYDSLWNDLNEVRNQVNELGNVFSKKTKYKAWAPISPFRKELLCTAPGFSENMHQYRSESVSSLGSCTTVRMTSRYARAMSSGSNLDTSNSSLDRMSMNGVEGYGCCFGGSTTSISSSRVNLKSYPHGNVRHSWGPSRSGSRSTLDDFDETDEDLDLSDDDVAHWRVKISSVKERKGLNLTELNGSDNDLLRERVRKFREFREQLLHLHNEYRVRHGCPGLTMSEELTSDAQQWADVLAEKGYAQYSELPARGENILLLTPAQETMAEEVAVTWYRESKNYSYSAARWQRGTANFTQMVWRSTTSMGVGVARLRGGATRYIIVVQYRPQGNGNRPGEFLSNVLPVVNISEDTT